ncbi:flagellar assembly protein FliW [Faecalimicrobium sp. JNUCC 81]
MEILFDKGIPGLEEYKVFTINEIEENTKFKIINSKEDINIGFIAISPFEVKNDYEINLNDDIINDLEIENPNDVLILNLITLSNTLEQSTVNLKAPLVINIKNNKGKQLILQDDKYSIKEPLTGSEKNVSSY